MFGVCYETKQPKDVISGSASALRVRSSQESLVKVGTKPRPNLSNQKHENIKSASSCDQKSSNRKPNQTSRCVVAMATLLDYVVNEVKDYLFFNTLT